MKIKLGSYVKDSITGFAGIAVARIEYLNGCVRYHVQPQDLHEGKPIDPVWIDEQQLVVTAGRKKVGGPGAIPPAFAVPD